VSPLEEQCLDKIHKGLLRLRKDGEVEYFHCGRLRWYPKAVCYHPETRRAKYQFNGGKYVYRNRLLMMFQTGAPIPDDCYVDHQNGCRVDDSPENLQLQKIEESHSQGNGFQLDKHAESLGRWFGFVSDFGREPQTPAEQTWIECGF
jgi:hypothetical protein